MKKNLFLIVLSVILFIMACGPRNNSDRTLNAQQETLMNEATRQVGMPAIVNFQERKLAKMIFELRDQENLLCYAYIKCEYTGELIYIGKCIGYGLPYSIQYTNPEKIVNRYGDSDVRVSDVQVIPQADPNGLFMPTGLSATWLMMIDPKTNEPHPVYIEPEIVVSPFELPHK